MIFILTPRTFFSWAFSNLDNETLRTKTGQCSSFARRFSLRRVDNQPIIKVRSIRHLFPGQRSWNLERVPISQTDGRRSTGGTISRNQLEIAWLWFVEKQIDVMSLHFAFHLILIDFIVRWNIRLVRPMFSLFCKPNPVAVSISTIEIRFFLETHWAVRNELEICLLLRKKKTVEQWSCQLVLIDEHRRKMFFYMRIFDLFLLVFKVK